MFSSRCAICLCKNKTLNSMKDTDDDKVSWQLKLKSFIPEEFSETYKICKVCCEEVDRVVKFKKQCLEALKRNKVDVFYCINCNKSYKHKTVLLRHISHFHTRIFFKISESNFNLSLKSTKSCYDGRIDVKSELKPSKVEADFTCRICSSILKSKYCLKRHLNSVHATEKRFSCIHCNQKFVNQIYLKAHIRYHSQERPFVCTKCGKGFFSSSDLNHHEQIHANIRAYRCGICPKAFNTSSDRTKHQLCVHTDPATWRFSCTVCGRKFPQSGNRAAHERTHTSSKPHSCHLCARAFSTAYTLKRHITAHSEEKRYNCTEQQCAAEYKNARSLAIHKHKNHRLISTNLSEIELIKKKITYNCQSCPKSFVSRVKLDKHVCSHSGERPFKCDVCEKTFIDKSYVKQHMKIVHENIM